MVVLIQQATVPFTLIASMVLLGDRYKVGHFLGCVMVTIGVLATVWPMFRATDYSENVVGVPFVFHTLQPFFTSPIFFVFFFFFLFLSSFSIRPAFHQHISLSCLP